ncbi:MAG TPA: DUF1801 domain-containing protein [Catalimonadaceae bacterium]|nr:DUF1801 domain-containing protein [Catalimonadaceae bacterium]
MPDIKTQIHDYIASQPAPKQADLLELHYRITGLNPSAQLWFLDGKDENGKTVSNPNIGYGHLIMPLAGGKSREFYQVGISANQTGISVYIMGLADKTFLPRTIGDKIGKATVTGYCIKFKALKDIDLAVLESAVRVGFGEKEQA